MLIPSAVQGSASRTRKTGNFKVGGKLKKPEKFSPKEEI
jgi:hypothetical protein